MAFRRRDRGNGTERDVLRTSLLATLAIAIAVAVMASTQGGPAYFVQLGEQSRSLELARDLFGEDVPTPVSDGHDGERFWLLARDPLLSDARELAQLLDRPLYRAQRIAYPALASPWGLAGEEALLWGLVVTNLLAVSVGTYFTGSLVARERGSRLAGYCFALNPLVWLAVLFDLSDAVALVGLVGVIWSLRRGRYGWVVGLGILAALAKDSSLLGLGALATLSSGLAWRQRVLTLVPAALATGVWRLYVMSQLEFANDPEIQEFMLVPFSGFAEAWRGSWGPDERWVYAALSIAVVPVAAAIVAAWWRRRGSLELCAALPYAVIVPFLSGQVLSVPINSYRAIGPALTLAAAGLMVTRAPAWRTSTTPSA